MKVSPCRTLPTRRLGYAFDCFQTGAFSAREELQGVVKSGNLDFCFPPRVPAQRASQLVGGCVIPHALAAIGQELSVVAGKSGRSTFEFTRQRGSLRRSGGMMGWPAQSHSITTKKTLEQDAVVKHQPA